MSSFAPQKGWAPTRVNEIDDREIAEVLSGVAGPEAAAVHSSDVLPTGRNVSVIVDVGCVVVGRQATRSSLCLRRRSAAP